MKLHISTGGNLKYILLVLFLLFAINSATCQINLNVKADRSPVVVAKEVSSQYGMRFELVLGLFELYQKEGLTKKDRRERIEALIQQYQEIPETEFIGYQLSDRSRQAFSNSPHGVTKLLEWDLTLKTEGRNSPAIFATGNVEVLYGMPPKAFFYLWEKLEKQYEHFSERIDQIKILSQKYAELELELSTRREVDLIAQQAGKMLEKGEIQGALTILEGDFNRDRLNLSARAFDIAETRRFLYTKNRNEKTIYYYREALRGQPDNPLFNNQLGDFFSTIGKIDSAIKYLNIALEIDTLAFGLFHHDVAVRFNNLSVAYEKNGEYELGVSMIKSAIQIDSTLLGFYNESLAREFINLASLSERQGRFDEAIRCYATALSIDSLILGMDHPDLAILYNNLGLVYYDIGDYQHADSLFKRSLAIENEVYGDCHHRFAASINNIGLIKHALGDFSGAVQDFSRAIEIDTTLFGEGNPDVLNYYNNLGFAYAEFGEFEKALFFFKKAHHLSLDLYGQTHPATSRSLINIGTIYLHWEEYELAMKNLNEALGIDSLIFGSHHPRISTSHSNIGVAWARLGKNEKAAFHYHKALEIDKAFFGEKHQKVALRYQNLGSLCERSGKYEESELYLQKALFIYTQAFGDVHPAIGTLYLSMARLSCSKGMFSQSISRWEKSLEILLQFLPEDNPKIKALKSYYGDTRLKFGNALLARGRLDSAILHFEFGGELANENRDTFLMASCHAQLGNIYSSKLEPETALRFFDHSDSMLLLWGNQQRVVADSLIQMNKVHRASVLLKSGSTKAMGKRNLKEVKNWIKSHKKTSIYSEVIGQLRKEMAKA